jgi:mono/diheme cytochrome c family protein
MRLWILGALAAALAAAPGRAQDPAGHARAGEGKRVYQRANCVGCHKWHGDGGGGYGGAALSLRATQLTREQIVEVVNCGRPGTGMPYHQRGAYDGDGCYGLSRESMGKDAPVEAAAFLRPGEVEAVADYVLAAMKGRGEPGYADCAAFFGEGARVCNTYKAAQPTAAPQRDGG